MLPRKGLIFSAAVAVLAQFALTRVSFCYSTDELIGKATNVTTSLVRGDVNGAASQAISGYHIPVASGSSLYASPSNVGIQQAIKPLSASNPYLNIGTTYHAAVHPLRPTNLSHNLQVNSGNSFFSNSTTLPVPPNFKKNN